MSRRIEQVNSFVQENLNRFFLEEIELPKNTLVTIIKVETATDLSRSRVFLSILPITATKEILLQLNKSAKHFRYLLSQEFQGYHVPRIIFINDETQLKVRLIEREIEELHQE